MSMDDLNTKHQILNKQIDTALVIALHNNPQAQCKQKSKKDIEEVYEINTKISIQINK